MNQTVSYAAQDYACVVLLQALVRKIQPLLSADSLDEHKRLELLKLS